MLLPRGEMPDSRLGQKRGGGHAYDLDHSAAARDHPFNTDVLPQEPG